MNNSPFPILEHDPTLGALIEPSRLHPNISAPEKCLVCFFREAIRRLDEEGRLTLLYDLHSEMGANPLYEMSSEGERIALFHPGIGAPLAGGNLEEVIALGCRKFVCIGAAGVLDSGIGLGHIVVPTSAVRDEGTSYHYLPPSREVEPSPEAVAAIIRTLERRGVLYSTGKTWTTDGVFRETPDKVRLRRAEGCITVEMEAAAFFAVAKFRGVTFGQILYGGDDVSGDEWDTRKWTTRSDLRWAMVELAIEALMELS